MSRSHDEDDDDPILTKVREICLALPLTKETPTWDSPHFRVEEKIFAGAGAKDGRRLLAFKLEHGHAQVRVTDPRFWPAPYVGKHGWVQTDPAVLNDWDLIASLLRESYTLIASKRALAALAATMTNELSPEESPTSPTERQRKKATKKKATKAGSVKKATKKKRATKAGGVKKATKVGSAKKATKAGRVTKTR